MLISLLQKDIAPILTSNRGVKSLFPAGLLTAGLFTIAVGATSTALADNLRTDTSSYSLRVPVVDAVPVVEQRTVERPERRCEPVGSGGSNAANETYHSTQRYDRRYEDRRFSERSGGVGAQILGGLIGGAIGNQFGGGNGRKALTIAGALVGSSIARGGNRHPRDYDRRRLDSRSHTYEPDYVCRTSYKKRVIEEVVGYDVTYSYNDALHSKRMDYDPGDTLELRVRAIPDVAIDAEFEPRSTESIATQSGRLSAPRSSRRTL